jgi:hypothetical protein
MVRVPGTDLAVSREVVDGEPLLAAWLNAQTSDGTLSIGW